MTVLDCTLARVAVTPGAEWEALQVGLERKLHTCCCCLFPSNNSKSVKREAKLKSGLNRVHRFALRAHFVCVCVCVCVCLFWGGGLLGLFFR